MKMKMRAALLLAGFVSVACFARGADVASLIAKGDSEEKQRRMRDAIASFQQAEQLDPKNATVQVRLSKLYSDLVTKPRKPDAEENARKALAHAQKAYALDPKNAKAHVALAISYGTMTDFVGNKTKVEYSKHIRDHAARATELDPTEDFAWHILGRWHFGVANVNGFLRGLAKIAYGGLPPASNEEAARCLKKACELAPQKIIHHSELARIYTTLGDKEAAAKEWKAVLSLPAVDDEDQRDKAEARQALGVK